MSSNICFPNHLGTSQGDSYQQASTPIHRNHHISSPRCAHADYFIFPLLCYSPMIKTGIETLAPWREFYHRFHTSGHLSHQAPRNCRAGVEDGGKSGHLRAGETPTCRRELRQQQLLHSTAVACWQALVVQGEVWTPALAPGTFPMFHAAQSLPIKFQVKF